MGGKKPHGVADARLAAVLDSIGDVYYVLDRDWRMVMFNTAAEAFFGLSRDRMLGLSLWDIYPSQSSSPFTALLKQAMDEGVGGQMTAPSRLRPGRVVTLKVTPLGDHGIGVAAEDVTDRLAHERAIAESKERLDLAVGAHAIGIFDWHLSSGRTVWTGEMEEIFGLERGAFEGHTDHFRRRVLPDDLARIEAETAAAVAAGQGRVSYEFRIRREDGVVRWIEGAARFIFDPDGELVRVVGTNVDITDRKAAETHQRLLINELNHRVKNTLAIVQAVAFQSFRGAPRPSRDAFEGRLAALSAAHDVLTRQKWEAGEIGQIIAVATAPHHPGDGRLAMEGPALALEPKTAVALGLAVHELATNAVKYGALSTADGRVDVRWTADDGVLRLTWRESGGPPVKRPRQKGFGVRMLEQGLAGELGGAVRVEFRPEGLVCAMEAPLARGAADQ